MNRCARRAPPALPQLAQRREVVEHPDRAALRRGDQIVAVDEQVARPRRSAGCCCSGCQLSPSSKRDEDAGFVAGVEQARPDGIGANDADEMAGGQAARDLASSSCRRRACARHAGANRRCAGRRPRHRRCRDRAARDRCWRSCSTAAMPGERHVASSSLPPSRVMLDQAVVGADPDFVAGDAGEGCDRSRSCRSRRAAVACERDVAVAMFARPARLPVRSGLMIDQRWPWSVRAEEDLRRPGRARTAAGARSDERRDPVCSGARQSSARAP